jgi:hypothetical protein
MKRRRQHVRYAAGTAGWVLAMVCVGLVVAFVCYPELSPSKHERQLVDTFMVRL